ncbi:hypothetical protein MJO29_011119 [Puccinia striiformis f. sp. tritici]|nr:hypothetical protein MJO29_011119 [Puccinia striiformis f. sp. tritici]
MAFEESCDIDNSSDLRNHGESQATPGCTSYLDYSGDVKHFITINGLKNVMLIGHLMGGKVAMTLALESSISTHKPDSELIKKLIAVDISPAKGPISESFQIYIDGFKESNSRSISRQPIPINEFEEDRSVCDLITNRSLSGTTPSPTDIASPVVFTKPLLSIKGTHRKYINKYNVPTIQAFFSNCKLVVLDANHWA